MLRDVSLDEPHEARPVMRDACYALPKICRVDCPRAECRLESLLFIEDRGAESLSFARHPLKKLLDRDELVG